MYGKSVNDLQSNVTISDGAITGTLHYVEQYTGFNPANPGEQEGNYLALKIEADADADISFELVGGSKGEFTLPPDDRQVVCLIRDNSSQSIRVTANKGGKRNEQDFSLLGLTLESKEG